MQPTNIDITLYRRQTTELLYRVPKDLTDYDVYFVVKSDKQVGTVKIIEKISTSTNQLINSYTYPYSYLTVKIYPSDTNNLNNERYYYELYAVNKLNAEDLLVFYYGKLNLNLSVSTATDTSQTIAVIYYDRLTKSQRLALGSTLTMEHEGKVFVYDTEDDTQYVWIGDGWA